MPSHPIPIHPTPVQVGETCAVAFVQMPGVPSAPTKPEPEMLSIGDCVQHNRLGTGEVIEISGDNLTVKFGDAGTKRVREEFLHKAA